MQFKFQKDVYSGWEKIKITYLVEPISWSYTFSKYKNLASTLKVQRKKLKQPFYVSVNVCEIHRYVLGHY